MCEHTATKGLRRTRWALRLAHHGGFARGSERGRRHVVVSPIAVPEDAAAD